MNRSTEKPEAPLFRAVMVPGEDAGLGEGGVLFNLLRKRADVWIPSAPTVDELDQIKAAMVGADNGQWYWIY